VKSPVFIGKSPVFIGENQQWSVGLGATAPVDTRPSAPWHPAATVAPRLRLESLCHGAWQVFCWRNPALDGKMWENDMKIMEHHGKIIGK